MLCWSWGVKNKWAVTFKLELLFSVYSGACCAGHGVLKISGLLHSSWSYYSVSTVVHAVLVMGC